MYSNIDNTCQLYHGYHNEVIHTLCDRYVLVFWDRKMWLGLKRERGIPAPQLRSIFTPQRAKGKGAFQPHNRSIFIPQSARQL